MRFLIVDDSPADVELLCSEFEREGYNLASCRVETEGGLSDALHTAEWDMAIADNSMPRLNSMQALNVVKNSGRDIPFIIYSGTMNHRNASIAMREGVQDYVMKGDCARLIPSVERELKSAAVRNIVMKRAQSQVYLLAYYQAAWDIDNICVEEHGLHFPGLDSACAG